MFATGLPLPANPCRIGLVASKLPVKFAGRGHLDVYGRRLILAPALIVDEDESFVFLNWAAESASKLILLKDGSWVGGKRIVILGIEDSVAQEFECASVKLVRPGFGYDVDLSAAVVSIFRVKVVGDDPEFPRLNRGWE